MIKFLSTIILVIFFLINTPLFADTIVKTFSGSGTKNTRPFTVNDQWEIQWDVKGDSFSIFLYTTDDIDMSTPVQFADKGKGSSYQEKGGNYYLKVIAVGNWTINIVQLGAKKSLQNKYKKSYIPQKYLPAVKNRSENIPGYRESRSLNPSGKTYKINDQITLHNPSDTAVAIYRDETLDKITKLFRESRKIRVLDSRAEPDKYPTAFKIYALLKDGSEYTGWIPVDKMQGDIKQTFSNGTSAKVINYKINSDRAIVYEVQISLKDGREYTGWIPEGVVND